MLRDALLAATDVLRIISPACLIAQDHYTSLLGSTVSPFVVVAALGAGMLFLRTIWRRHEEREWIRTRSFNAM